MRASASAAVIVPAPCPLHCYTECQVFKIKWFLQMRIQSTYHISRKRYHRYAELESKRFFSFGSHSKHRAPIDGTPYGWFKTRSWKIKTRNPKIHCMFFWFTRAHVLPMGTRNPTFTYHHINRARTDVDTDRWLPFFIFAHR